MMVEKVPDSTYDMIGGLDQQIKEIKEVIELGLKHPELFESLGIAQPKGVLLYGPPGTGKTLLARAVAHHTDCKFIRVSGSELVQKYIGEGSRMVRELFVMAREHAPSIIFMDEIDSIGSSRVEGSSGGDSEVQRTMLELLNQLDGFEPTKNIKVIMATNRLDILDPALLRPGRIDRKIEFPPPTVEARADILRIHSRSMNLTRGINLTKVAEKMNGCSGAELKGVCTEAGMYALRERRVHVTQEDFDLATAKVLNKHDDKEDKFVHTGRRRFADVLNSVWPNYGDDWESHPAFNVQQNGECEGVCGLAVNVQASERKINLSESSQAVATNLLGEVSLLLVLITDSLLHLQIHSCVEFNWLC